MRPVVTLVHGTFARGAPWTQPGSKLCQGLAAGLDDPWIPPPFPWSGENNQRDRVAAGEALARRLECLAAEEPGAPQFLVAHSHGGNIALYAAAQTEARIAGIVCLSTPFLAVHRRNLPVLRDSLLTLAVGVAGGLTALVALLADVPAAFVGLVLLASLVAVVLPSALAVRAIGRHAGSTIRAFEYDLRPALPLFIIRTNRDEAAGGLSAAHIVPWALLRAWTGATDRVARLTGGPIYQQAEKRDLLTLTRLPVAFAAQLLVAAPVLGLALIAGGFARLFSGDTLLTALTVEISGEAAPPGEWPILQLDTSGPGLAHSHAYEDDRAIARLAEWMREQARVSGSVTDPALAAVDVAD